MNNTVELIILFIVLYVIGVICDSTHYFQYLLRIPIRSMFVKILLFGPYIRWDYTWDAVMVQALRCAWMLVVGGVFLYKKLGFAISDKSVLIIVAISSIVVLLIEFVPIIVGLIKAKHREDFSRRTRVSSGSRMDRRRRRKK